MDIKIISAIAVGLLLVGFVVVTKRDAALESTGGAAVPVENVVMSDGQQIITIDVKGGYSPRESVGTAGVPTTIRFDTKGTFDCSAAVRIPSLRIAQALPPTGSTDIDIGTPGVGELTGSCGMGMYSFTIAFK